MKRTRKLPHLGKLLKAVYKQAQAGMVDHRDLTKKIKEIIVEPNEFEIYNPRIVITVPSDYDDTYVRRYSEYMDFKLTKYRKPTQVLKPGEKLRVIQLKATNPKLITTKHCIDELVSRGAIFSGLPGLCLIFDELDRRGADCVSLGWRKKMYDGLVPSISCTYTKDPEDDWNGETYDQPDLEFTRVDFDEVKNHWILCLTRVDDQT